MVYSNRKIIIFAVTIYLCSTINTCHALRILGLFPFHVQSHFVMCEQLMIGLAQRGHQVDVYSHFPLKKSIPNYTDFSLEGSLPSLTNNMSFSEVSLPSGPDMIAHWWTLHGEPVCDLMSLPVFQKLLNDPPMDPPYDLIINELSTIYCYIPFGRRLNIPIIGIVTPPFIDWMHYYFGTPLNLAADPSLFSEYSRPMNFLERVGNVITYYRVVWTCFRYSEIQEKYVEKYFGSGFPNIMDLLKDMSLVLINHDTSVSGVKPLAPIVVPVGGLHIVDHNETLLPIVQKWLDDSEDGFIYFSFGSMGRIETFPKHVLSSFYKSFENIKPVRVLLKIVHPEELPPNLPSNVLTQPWLQQIQVLKHKNIRAFVTHGGLMGTLEAVYYGVPMIGIPLFGDQHFNIGGYVKKNICVKIGLDDITEQTFTKAIKEILYNPLYSQTIKKVSKRFRDRPMRPIDTSVYWIEYIARHGKDALKSPTADMPWWQISLLDVYGFILAVVLLVFYISARILKVLEKLVRGYLIHRTKIKSN